MDQLRPLCREGAALHMTNDGHIAAFTAAAELAFSGGAPDFSGGVIAAGVETGIRALARNTAQLSAIKLRTPDHIIGKNTAECMLSGAVAGTAVMLDGIVGRIEEELGEHVTLVLTGGAARLVEPLLRHAHIHDPEMLTLGLAYLYDRNRERCPLAGNEAE